MFDRGVWSGIKISIGKPKFKARRHSNMDGEYESSYEPYDESEESVVQIQPCILSRMALNDNKAGMEGLDKEKINK